MFLMLPPPADLAPYVRFFWSAQGAAASTPQRVLPDGSCELIWQLSAPMRRLDSAAHEQPPAFLFGQIERAICLQASGAIDVLGVRLTPAGVAALWRIDVRSLGPNECALRDLFAHGCVLSAEQLRDAPAQNETARFAARCALVVDWLRTHVRSRVGTDARRALAALPFMAHPGVDIANVARTVGVSRRGLERAFATAVGLSPAAYLRVRRVDACGRELRRGVARLSAIAAAAGYADQAHFSREFRDVAGLSPAAYRAEQGLQTPLLP